MVSFIPAGWTRGRRLVSAMFALSMAACGDGNVIGPDNQLEVANLTDNFEWQVSALDDVSQTLDYAWENTGPEATIDIAGSLSAGTATLTVTDAAGTQVFSGSLDNSNNTNTSAGEAGIWRVVVVIEGAHGALNFRIEKKTQ